jgi:hypothetical protein
MLGGGSHEPSAIADIIFLAIVDRFAVVATLNEVQRLIGKKVAAKSGHGSLRQRASAARYRERRENPL